VNMTESKNKKISRRDAIKLLGAAAGASVLANLPTKWNTPEIVSGVLPAHAQTSTVQNVGCPGLGLTVTLSLFLGDVDLRILTPGGFFVNPKLTGANQGLVDPFTGATHSGDAVAGTETITVPVGNLTNGTWTISVNLAGGVAATPYIIDVIGACTAFANGVLASPQVPLQTYSVIVDNCVVTTCVNNTI
jgi:hypothetical protein